MATRSYPRLHSRWVKLVIYYGNSLLHIHEQYTFSSTAVSILTKTAKFFDFKTRILIEKLSVVIEN